ncbi:hypothetical protein M758_2G114000 [Ceratodon purpureus]|nr:hypothetical protein M758_2G114000 [Ceratodon purpureus]
MRNNRVSKRRRQDSSVHNSYDSTEDDTVSDGNEYYHKAKGKRKVREDDVQGQEAGEKEVETKQEEKVVQVCGICLTEEEVERGKLDCCDHYFCFGCIMEWAKVESRCPTCKQRFVTVVRPSVPGMPRSRPRTFHIPLRNQVYEPSEEEIRLFTDPYLHVVCTECQEAGDERLLLLCDRCDAAAHTYCVGLGRSVPRGDWFCNMCSIQGQGFNSDDQGHEEEYNEEHEEQEPEFDEDDSNPLLPDLVADVQPIQRRRPPRRRTSAPRLSRASGRHTRLHPAPAISHEAQVYISLNQEAGGSSSVSSDIESTPAAARTLSSQRLIRQRVNDIRNNWDQLRRGELQFGSISHLGPRTRASQAHGRPSSNTSAVPEAAPSDDISQAWSMMEQARALREVAAVSNPASGTRAGGNRATAHGRMPTGGGEATVGPSRFNQAQEQSVRTGTAGGSNQLVENTTRLHSDQIQEQNPRRTNVREGSRLPEGRMRGHRGAAEEQSLRRENMREDNHVAENRSRHHRAPSMERDSRRENVRESNHLVESSTSGRHRISGRSGRQDNDSAQDVQASSVRERLSRDSNGGNVAVRSMPEGLSRVINERNVAVRNMPGSSVENERLQVADRSRRRAQHEDEEAHRSRTRNPTERRDMKEQVAQYVKAELKPLYRLGHIDKQQHIKIARMATQELLAAFGIEHLGPETRAFGSASSACNHLSSPSASFMFPNCCMQCVRHNVNKVVGVLVKKVVGTGIL